MDEQAQVVAVRRRRSRAEAGQLVAEYEASGLTRVEFCRTRGLSLVTLARYRKRRAQSSPAPENRWVAVCLPAAIAQRKAPINPGVGLTLTLS